MEELSQPDNQLIDLVMHASIVPTGKASKLIKPMRHGIDLKTHSQCQRRQPRLPDLPKQDPLSFHPGDHKK